MTTPINFAAVKHITLIGGGDLMAESAVIFQQHGFNVQVIVAPRHTDEKLVKRDKSLLECLTQDKITHRVISDINQLTEQQLLALIPEHSIAICYGPAWIFSHNVIQAFEYGMYNINPIPIPHYLGGAHYTWQILNQNREGGCVFQVITEQLDQGDIVAEHRFTLSADASTPDDYFIENITQGLTFTKQLAEQFSAGNDFISKSYQEFNQDRVYLPRLRTDKQAYINWQWHRDEIISFCQAFSSPYAGAATFVNEQEIRIKNITAVQLKHSAMHPFAAGVIVRKLNDEIIVSAVGGFLKITELPELIYRQLKEGMRLFTPASILDQAMQYQVVLTADGFKD